MIREQLMLITSQLGQLTGAERSKQQQQCPKPKNKRPRTFPDRKEKQKIMSIRISLPQDGKNGGPKRTKTSHSSPNTVMSMTSVDSFGLKLNKVRNSDSETDSVASDKQEVDPFDALQGIASATPTACNDLKNSKQHNTDSVMSSGVVPAFQLPAWRLAPELDVPQFRLIEDYGDVDPHFGPGYDFLSAAWSVEERLGSCGPRKKKKRQDWKREDGSVEVKYQKSYRNNKRRSLPCGGKEPEADVEDTSDEVYRRLHQSQEKAEKERMTSLYNKRLKDSGKPSRDLEKGHDTASGATAAPEPVPPVIGKNAVISDAVSS